MELAINKFSNLTWVDTPEFEGYIQNNSPFKGRGHFRYLNGDYIFYGEWSNGNIHNGIGCITIDNMRPHIKVYFIGGWKNGIKSGYVIVVNLNKNNPDEIDELYYNEIIDGESINSTELNFEKPLSRTKFLEIYNECHTKYMKDPKYRAW